MKILIRMIVLCMFSSCHVMAVEDERYAGYSLLVTSAIDDGAILQSSDGAMLSVKAGYVVEAVDAEVVQVLDDRIVLREKHDSGDHVIIYLKGTRNPQYQRITAQVPVLPPAESFIIVDSIPIDVKSN